MSSLMNKMSLPSDENSFAGHVMVISEDVQHSRVLEFMLQQMCLNVAVTMFNEQVMELFYQFIPDLVILDDVTTEPNELVFLQNLRGTIAVPILLLCVRNDEAYITEAYQFGADDVMPQPVSIRIFQAKVRAWLQRAQVIPMTSLEEIQAGSFRLKPENRRLVTQDYREVRLTNLETRLLFILMSHPNRLFATEILVDRVWGCNSVADGILLKNLVYRLRQKIETDPSHPRYLITESNQGYLFCSGERPTRPLK